MKFIVRNENLMAMKSHLSICATRGAEPLWLGIVQALIGDFFSPYGFGNKTSGSKRSIAIGSSLQSYRENWWIETFRKAAKRAAIVYTASVGEGRGDAPGRG